MGNINSNFVALFATLSSMSPGIHQTSSIPRSYQLINDFTVGHGREQLRRLEHHDIRIWHLCEVERYKSKTKFATKVSP